PQRGGGFPESARGEGVGGARWPLGELPRRALDRPCSRIAVGGGSTRSAAHRRRASGGGGGALVRARRTRTSPRDGAAAQLREPGSARAYAAPRRGSGSGWVADPRRGRGGAADAGERRVGSGNTHATPGWPGRSGPASVRRGSGRWGARGWLASAGRGGAGLDGGDDRRMRREATAGSPTFDPSRVATGGRVAGSACRPSCDRLHGRDRS